MTDSPSSLAAWKEELFCNERVVVFTDGACRNNQDARFRRAGYGVFWADGHPLNISSTSCKGGPKQTIEQNSWQSLRVCKRIQGLSKYGLTATMFSTVAPCICKNVVNPSGNIFQTLICGSSSTNFLTTEGRRKLFLSRCVAMDSCTTFSKGLSQNKTGWATIYLAVPSSP